MTEHLGYEKGDPAGRGSGNSRNGTSGKKVLTGIGAVEIDVPRDRNEDFAPKVVPKGARRLSGFNVQVLSLYARGMSVRAFPAGRSEIPDQAVAYVARLVEPIDAGTTTGPSSCRLPAEISAGEALTSAVKYPIR